MECRGGCRLAVRQNCRARCADKRDRPFDRFHEDFAQRIIAAAVAHYTGLFISPSGISELDCATIKTDTAERSISIGTESLQVFFVLGALAYFQVPPLGGSREEK